MVRIDDGMRGIVAQNGPELRIMYLDRGEERLALKSEKWEPAEFKPGKMRDEEMRIVALYADRALQAYERHEPMRWWEIPLAANVPYDAGLVRAIEAYLAARTG